MPPREPGADMHRRAFLGVLDGAAATWAHMKLAALALWPIGMTIVPVESVPERNSRR